MTSPTRRGLRAGILAAATTILFVAGSLAGGAPALAADGDLPFATTPIPTLTDAPQVDDYVSVSTGTWSPAPTSFSYQWFEDGAAVTGATRNFLRPADGDLGKELSVAVTASRVGYVSTTETSVPAEIVGTISGSGLSISGLPKPGDTITAHATIVPADANLAYQWRDPSGPIPGATGPTYVPSEDEAGQLLTVTISAARDGYADAQFEVSTTATGDRMRTQSAYATGSITEGSTLTASGPSGWYPVPTTVRYQWMRDGVELDGETAPSYTSTGADVGHSLSFRMTGSHAEFPDATVVSQPTPAIQLAFDFVSTPVISGVPEVGVPLTVTIPAWSPAASLYDYAWFLNGRQDYSQTGSTYTPTSGAVGGTIAVMVYGFSATRGTTPSPLSAASQPVVANPYKLGSVSLGTSDLNRAEKVKFTTPPAGVTVEYQWLLSGAAIDGATKSTYTPEGNDWHHHLSVRLTVSGAGYATSTVTSNSELVHDGSIDPGSAQITPGEEARVGATLHAQPLGWAPSNVKVHFQWVDEAHFNPVSYSSTFTVPASDYGKRIDLYAWGSATHLGSTRSHGMYGTDYRVIAGLFSRQPNPTITGTAQVGSKLTLHRGTWSPSTKVSYRYQWYEQGSASATPVAISKATSSSYTPTAAVAGQLITVRVTASKHAYSTTYATSVPTGMVTN